MRGAPPPGAAGSPGHGRAGDAPVVLDVRGLPAPEPLERALSAAQALASGAELVVLTPLMPYPLLQLLSARGFEAAAEFLPGGQARVRVRRP